MSWSRRMAAYSNSSIFAASRIFFSSFSISALRSDSVIFTPSRRLPPLSASEDISMTSRTLLTIVLGTMPCALLYESCFFRLRSVSVMAARIEGVTVSAYIITRPSAFLAARPIVWIRLVSLLRKPSLSASSIATSETSGRSRPSLSRFMPTSTSNSPRRRSRIISMRSMAPISWCI